MKNQNNILYKMIFSEKKLRYLNYFIFIQQIYVLCVRAIKHFAVQFAFCSMIAYVYSNFFID